MITLGERAVKKIKKMNINSLYINIEYRQGPCNDNLCRMIPVVYVSLRPEGVKYYLIYDVEIKVFVSDNLYRSIIRHRDQIRIDFSPLRKKFVVSGFTYAF
ncbi:MAG: hypothetical protein ACP5G5_06105 [Thermoplasmata archaeon]|jgi:hypothetical protein|nr:hypothetical protein [Thermoplasmatales archaeon]PMP75691.1 MAG: hypothetical protein C0180_00700 [Aciduliprofundum sp.]